MRTTMAELEQLVRILNERLGRPQYGWYTAPNGQNTSRVGALYLEVSYGQPRLAEVVNASGGVAEHSPRLTKAGMADWLRAMIKGIEFAEINVVQADKSWVGLPGWMSGRIAERLR